LRDSLPDPSVLRDMDKAAAHIAAAIASGERCGVFGDYDVDGTCGAALLKQYFNALGAPLEIYLPDRLLEGYGPTIEAFRALKEKGVRVIITVDCGAAAHAAIAAAAAEGLEVIVLDHHQMDGPPPPLAIATVNPNRVDDSSGLTMLSAAGVAFMTLVAVNRALRARRYFDERPEPDLRRFLDLVALALVCDVMPMIGVARILTAQGLKILAAGGNAGLAALRARAGSNGPPTAYDLGFVLGPRINAAGRIGHARLAFDLLTADDESRRSLLADRLHALNAERQTIEEAVQAQAQAKIERLQALPKVLAVAAEGWHVGVVGIVAGRLKERYERPSVVIGIADGIGKGSARSIPGVDIGEALRAARAAGLLIAGGGHAMAGGLTVAAERIDSLAAFLEERCAGGVERALAARVQEIDAVIAASATTAALAAELATAGPYGPGNPEPLFALTSLTADRLRLVGGRHIACELSSAGGERLRAIAFRAEGEPLGALLRSGVRMHVAGRVRTDSFRGGGAQLHIVDAAAAV
jgi:single-stranded-DNA-specific exonuclease